VDEKCTNGGQKSLVLADEGRLREPRTAGNAPDLYEHKLIFGGAASVVTDAIAAPLTVRAGTVSHLVADLDTEAAGLPAADHGDPVWRRWQVVRAVDRVQSGLEVVGYGVGGGDRVLAGLDLDDAVAAGRWCVVTPDAPASYPNSPRVVPSAIDARVRVAAGRRPCSRDAVVATGEELLIDARALG
jgi:hypothetical protein